MATSIFTLSEAYVQRVQNTWPSEGAGTNLSLYSFPNVVSSITYIADGSNANVVVNVNMFSVLPGFGVTHNLNYASGYYVTANLIGTPNITIYTPTNIATFRNLTKGNVYTFTALASYNGANSLPAYNSNTLAAVRTAPGAPIIVSANAINGSTANITYTAPADNGANTIISYIATSSPGNITGNISQSGSGIITVNGLTEGQTYTFTVTATNSIGTGPASSISNSIVPRTLGSQSYIAAGTYSFIPTAGVTSVSIVAVGGGGGAGGSVYPTIRGQDSYFGYPSNVVIAGGGQTQGVPSTILGDAGYQGGQGASNTGGGGGAGGYAGAGGKGAISFCNYWANQTAAVSGCAGTGGGGGGGGAGPLGNTSGPTGKKAQGAGGGGVGLFGLGPSGAGGCGNGYGGGGGSGGYAGGNVACTPPYVTGGAGGGPAGGAGGVNNPPYCSGFGHGGGGGSYGGGGGSAGCSPKPYNCTNACAISRQKSGNGGALAYKNNYPVTPGTPYTVVVGAGGGTRCISYPWASYSGYGGGGAVRVVWPGNLRQFPSTCVGTP